MKFSFWIVSLFAFVSTAGMAMCQKPRQVSVFPTSPTVVTRALREICPSGLLTKDRNGRVNGCTVCPKQTGAGSGWVGGWALNSALTGRFGSNSADLLLLGGSGCEPHSLNFGGTFVFNLNREGPAFLHYNGGLQINRCTIFHEASGRDLIVCEDQWGSQGNLWSRLYRVSLLRSGEARISPIFTTYDSVATCGIGPDGRAIDTIQHSGIRDFQLVSNTNGKVILVVTATLGRKRLTQAERRQCSALLPGSQNDLARQMSITTRVEHIVFYFNDVTFLVAPASRAAASHFPRPLLPY